ncbi:MAG TPA: hypothetical protein VFC79_02660 [Tissierellaceae bacterium]|nr:hypothetical protein [Tissierellaceae bacterium]
MRIKIVSAKYTNIWYANKIGSEYEVEDTGNFYMRKNNHFYKLFKEDCEFLEDINTVDGGDDEQQYN